MPELVEQLAAPSPQAPDLGAGGPGIAGYPEPRVTTEREERAARHELRRQIGRMERELGALFVSAFPRTGIEWTLGAAGPPRVLGIGELERVRDGLAARLQEARGELQRCAYVEERKRELLERVITEPAAYPWVRVSNEDIGDRGCRHWHSRPRWGPLGMLMGWWRVKVSSGCPLAT